MFRRHSYISFDGTTGYRSLFGFSLVRTSRLNWLLMQEDMLQLQSWRNKEQTPEAKQVVALLELHLGIDDDDWWDYD